jgi:four helix bundle protein
MSFKFEKLEIWKMAIEVADDVHNLTRSFPKDEMFSLTSQMKRAADSISFNIAEGSTGQSDPEQVKFIGYSQRSALEVVNCIYLATRRNYIDQTQLMPFIKSLKYLSLKFTLLKIQKKINC